MRAEAVLAMTKGERPGMARGVTRFLRNACQYLFTDIKMTAAIDVTSRCNLKCAHCYWWKERPRSELDDEQMIALMERQRALGKNAVILYGGEPMLRPDICREACRIFDSTMIFTNGTLGFLDIPARWMVSLDGTREVHDSIRGKGVYDTVMKNLQHGPPLKPVAHITITRQNQHNIEAFLAEMSTVERIKGVGFSFYTPEIGKDESDILIPLQERDRVLDELLRLRRKYWRIMGFNRAMAYQFRTDGAFSEWNSLKTCPVSYMVDAFHADGTPKTCTYGDNADCSRCGCTGIAVYRAAFKAFDPESLFIALALGSFTGSR
jgi:MoaA/NifB/PqqE/SkfB family radical SAM enzyme